MYTTVGNWHKCVTCSVNFYSDACSEYTPDQKTRRFRGHAGSEHTPVQTYAGSEHTPVQAYAGSEHTHVQTYADSKHRPVQRTRRFRGHAGSEHTPVQRTRRFRGHAGSEEAPVQRHHGSKDRSVKFMSRSDVTPVNCQNFLV